MTDLWPDPRPTLYAKACEDDRTGRLDLAVAAYRRLSRIWPADRAAVRYNLASLLARRGQIGRATTLFIGLADDTDAPAGIRGGAHFHLGRLAEVADRRGAARDHYRAALVAMPDHGTARARLQAIDASRDPSAAPIPRASRRRRRSPTSRPILVWQMGKVGSTSMLLGLRAALPSLEVWHSHALSEEVLARAERRLTEDRSAPTEASRQIAREIVEGRAVRVRLLGDGPRWRILTLTREPIGHLVSVLFHHLDYFTRLAAAPASPPETTVDVLHAFATGVLARTDGGRRIGDPRDAALTRAQAWFDRELLTVLGVDVRASPLDRTAGYTRIRTPRADVVVVRFEDLPWAAPAAVRALCGFEGFKMPTENRAADRPSGRMYADYLRRCRFPRALVEAALASPYATHAYTAAERAALAAHWSTGGSTD
jgi:hypothetical protein